MIWLWLQKSLLFIGWLFIPPPSSLRRPSHPVINPNADCPGCGNSAGHIQCVPFQDSGKMVIRHFCSICGARWHENTVVADNTGILWPSESAV